MSNYFSPLCNEQQNDANGAPLSGGKVFTYAAGTSTLATTYTEAGAAQANPIILNASGLPANAIWLQGGTSYKFIVQTAANVTLRTADNISGVNDPAVASATDQWLIYTGTPTYISATSFSVAGDQTNLLQKGRRLKSTNSGGTIYSSIKTTVFGAVTTVTVVNDSGTLDSGLSAVSYGIVSAANSSLPEGPAFSAYGSASQAITASTDTKVTLDVELFDTNANFATSRFTPTLAGYYQINGVIRGTATGATTYYAAIYKNGAVYAKGSQLIIAANSLFQHVGVSEVVYLNGTTDYVELFGFIDGTTPAFNFGAASSTSRFSGAYLRGG